MPVPDSPSPTRRATRLTEPDFPFSWYPSARMLTFQQHANKMPAKMPTKCQRNASKTPAKLPSKCQRDASSMPTKCQQHANTTPAQCQQNACKMPAKCQQNSEDFCQNSEGNDSNDTVPARPNLTSLGQARQSHSCQVEDLLHCKHQ